MIDYFALGLTHALLLFGAWRMVQRADLDQDRPAEPVVAADAADQDRRPVKRELKVRA